MMKTIKAALLGAVLTAIAAASVWSQTNPGLFSCAANSWMNSIGFGSVPVCAQPAVGNLANIAANTVLGNATSGSAAPTAETINGGASCANALIYTNGVGFGCNVGAGTGTVTSITIAAATGEVVTGTCTVTTSGTCTTGPDPATFTGEIHNCTLSNDGTNPNTTIDIAACAAVDSTNAVWIKGAAWTKIIATQGGNTCVNVFVAGSGTCGMTVTVVASTWYHVFAIVCTGAYDIYFDTSITAANKPACATSFRRIGSIKTDGASHPLAFTQVGEQFTWTVSPVEQSAVTTSATAATITLVGVPPGIKTVWQGVATMSVGAGGPCIVIYSSLDANDQAAVAGYGQMLGAASTSGGAGLFIPTSTAQGVRFRASSATGTLSSSTLGYVDTRGRFN